MLIRNLYPLFPGIDPSRFTINYQMNDLWVSVPFDNARIMLIFHSKNFDIYYKPIILDKEKALIAKNNGIIYQDQTLLKKNVDLANLNSSISEYLALIKYFKKA